MDDHAIHFLKQLLSAPGPSGDEVRAARVWRNEAQTFADEVHTDVRGNTYAVLKGALPRVLLAGHIDEIGLMITHIDSEGFLWFAPVGGWDAQVLVGQRVRLLGKQASSPLRMNAPWPSPAAALLELAGIVSQPGVHAEEGAENSPNPAPTHPSQFPQRGQSYGY